MQPLLIFNELKQVATDIHYINVLEIMNEEKDELAERYFAIIEEMVKENE